MISANDLQHSLPLLTIAFGAVVTLLIDAFSKNREVVFVFSIITVLTAMVLYIPIINMNMVIYNEFLKVNNISTCFNLIILAGILMTLFASRSYLIKEDINFGEFYSLLLFSVMGMILMVQANDLLVVFLGLELMSICFYVLAGFLRKRVKSNESAMKYFLLGAFMTGFLLYGIVLIYGVTGTTKLSIIFSQSFGLMNNTVFYIGFALFMIGFFFKMGVFPFHMWIPDVYDGAPTIVSGMMSTAGKIAAVGTIVPAIVFVNVVDFKMVFTLAAILTMMFGNVIAIAQTNMKRLLAYSSIASAGYIMVGVAALNAQTIKGVTYYLVAYTFMQLGAFIVVSLIETKTADGKDYKNINIEDYKGLAKRNPMLATFLTIFLFSLAGIPPFAGFWGKYYIFKAAIESNLIWLSIIGILLSVISVYYYLRVIVYMWFRESDEPSIEEQHYKIPPLVLTSLTLALAGTFVFGVYPDLFTTLFKMI
ncbi:MAG: NADH-quinone oxidoreductase subunit N [Ignavibacteriae bacterium]|nr:NADH-quinone oxidoreductase subunit N [Ignavibacteriota bacterium]